MSHKTLVHLELIILAVKYIEGFYGGSTYLYMYEMTFQCFADEIL